MTHLDDTDSPLASPTYEPPPPDNVDALREVARSIRWPFAFSHSTAAQLLGWPVPWSLRAVGDVHIMTETAAGRIRSPGFVGHRGLELREVVLLHDLPVISPAHTWADLGELVGRGLPYSFEDLIGAGDQALNAGCTRAQLRAVVESRVRPRGKRTLLPALGWIRPGSESMLETRWRLCCHRAGLPLPALNVMVYDARGHFLFRPDQTWRAKRVAVECQGSEFHDTPDAVAFDAARFARGERSGWQFFEIRSKQVWEEDERGRALRALADELDFPQQRLDLVAAEPQSHSPEAAATLAENLERRRRRSRARHLATYAPGWG